MVEQKKSVASTIQRKRPCTGFGSYYFRGRIIAVNHPLTSNSTLFIANPHLCDKNEKETSMKLLYKYYSNESQYAFDNIEKGKVCFTSLESLNDPFEGIGKYLYEVSDEDQIYWNTIGSDLPKLLSERFSKETWDMLNFKYRVFCSTKDYNNCLLWAYYANAHKGFCVGYKESDILKISDELLDVKYSNDMCSINKIDENTCKNLLTVKFSDWRNENECRAIYVLKDVDVSYLDPDVYYDKNNQSKDKMYKLHGHIQTNNLRTLCSNKFILKRCEPAVIYLGLRMKWDDKQRLVDIAKKLNIDVYQMFQKQGSFEFIPQNIYAGNL